MAVSLRQYTKLEQEKAQSHRSSSNLPLWKKAVPFGLLILFPFDCFGASFPVSAKGNLQLGCQILSTDLKVIRDISGDVCLFIPGTQQVLSFDDSGTRLRSLAGETIWEKPILLHHQMNLNRNAVTFATLGHEINFIEGEKTRSDVALVMDFKGNILKSFSFYQHLAELRKIVGGQLKSRNPSANAKHLAKREISHANSIYEIGPNALSSKIAAFKPGNFIVNINGFGAVVIFDKELKEILWSYSDSQNGREHSLHDVQVLPSGNLLAYVNRNQKDNVRFSSVDEINPLTGEHSPVFKGSPPESFSAQWCGGAQILPNDLVLSSESEDKASGLRTRIFIADRKSQAVLWDRDVSRFQKKPNDWIQQVKLVPTTF